MPAFEKKSVPSHITDIRTEPKQIIPPAMSLSQINAWSNVLVRSQATGQPQSFSIMSVGSYCVLCSKCQHQSLVTPNIHNALLCTHCEEELRIPLDAHFACPATLKSQFAVMQPFNIEQFLASQAHRLCTGKSNNSNVRAFVGVMDISITKVAHCIVCRETYPANYVPNKKHICACGARNSVIGLENATHSESGAMSRKLSLFLANIFPFIRNSQAESSYGLVPVNKKHVLAVVSGGTLRCYVTNVGAQQHRLVCQVELNDAYFASIDPNANIIGTAADLRIVMDLGSRDVANLWHGILVGQAQAVGSSQQGNIESDISSAPAATADINTNADIDASATALRLVQM
ncbi:hypothetical protein LPJ66_008036 [Kickxella alabastrina]|uniref:Uncharacterized protein n=1 Tax=Kickxella alabastrina TaxID=61397 RepID=A0ACC1IBH6_9FUNG|nr:hypothetical protein LPJ66_008036 [Kickxella alabastrina]